MYYLHICIADQRKQTIFQYNGLEVVKLNTHYFLKNG